MKQDHATYVHIFIFHKAFFKVMKAQFQLLLVLVALSSVVKAFPTPGYDQQQLMKREDYEEEENNNNIDNSEVEEKDTQESKDTPSSNTKVSEVNNQKAKQITPPPPAPKKSFFGSLFKKVKDAGKSITKFAVDNNLHTTAMGLLTKQDNAMTA
jgi:hypothetical protein